MQPLWEIPGVPSSIPGKKWKQPVPNFNLSLYHISCAYVKLYVRMYVTYGTVDEHLGNTFIDVLEHTTTENVSLQLSL